MSPHRSEKAPDFRVAVEGVGTFSVPAGLNLREGLRREGVYLDGTCADRGVCGRCVVRILEGETGGPSDRERTLLGAGASADGRRLACMVPVVSDLLLRVEGERLLEVDRTGRWKEVWGSPLWSPSRARPDGEGFGVALDLGTTALGAGLFDLDGGRPLDIRAAANPQLPWGEEIISRLGAAARDRTTAGELSRLIWSTAGSLIRSLCTRTGVSRGRITRVLVVGNSAMHHLSLGLPVTALLTPPYAPAQKAPVSLSGEDVPPELEIGEGAVVHFPPLLGGFAGSDALASLLAALPEGEGPWALLDVGTNTEIIVWDGAGASVGTAPSGPAFEGGHIRHGMRAGEGAVWKVEISAGDVRIGVLGDGPPRGVCGTGMIDTLAWMLKMGILERSGLLRPGSHPNLRNGSFLLDRASGVTLDGQDVANLQKAISAVASTFELLLDSVGMPAERLERVFLAGAFGSRLNVANAVAVGLLPPGPGERYVLAGNTALVGASMMLVSGEERLRAEQLAREVRHLDTAQIPEFEDLFLDHLTFPEP